VGHPVPDPGIAVELVTRSPAQYLKMISEYVSLAVAALHGVDDWAGASPPVSARHR
jgi:hypothetical protein